MKRSFLAMWCHLSLALVMVSPLPGQDSAESTSITPAEAEQAANVARILEGIEWRSEGTGELGAIAGIQVPEGYRFTGSAGTIQLMEMYGNLTNGSELGYIAPTDMGWFAVFEFDPCGYVKDDEKDELDADRILEQMKEGQAAANEELSKRGMSTLEVLGWQTPPFYNTATNNLEWAVRLASSDGSQVVNYKTKLLGRRGVMDVVLVCDEADMGTVVPAYQNLLKGYAFKQDESYAAFRQGDKIAEYGLTGLILGGGLLVAAKSGLLTKLWKPIVGGLIVIGAFLKRIFVGRTKETI